MREIKNFLIRLSLVGSLFTGLFSIIRLLGYGNSLLFEQITFMVIASTLVIFLWEMRKGAKPGGLGSHFPTSVYRYLSISLIIFSMAQATILNIDRSRSFYLLAWVQEGKVALVEDGVNLSQVISGEANSTTSIHDRVIEQSQRGLIALEGEDYRLTKKGKVVLWISELVGKVFKLEYWAANRI
jgi:hypothetical protein